MFHLQHDPSLYTEIERGQDDVLNVDYDAVRKTVIDGPGLELTQKLQREHSQAALDVLNQLPSSDARTALANIIAAIQDWWNVICKLQSLKKRILCCVSAAVKLQEV